MYCLDVETFADGNGDGVGDFDGLMSRLGYLSALGVDCLWLLPFYPCLGYRWIATVRQQRSPEEKGDGEGSPNPRQADAQAEGSSDDTDSEGRPA
jgi:hypothetical protein